MPQSQPLEFQRADLIRFLRESLSPAAAQYFISHTSGGVSTKDDSNVIVVPNANKPSTQNYRNGRRAPAYTVQASVASASGAMVDVHYYEVFKVVCTARRA